MKTEAEKIKIGAFSKPHGIAGEIVLRILPQWESYSPNPLYLFIELQGEQVPFQLKTLRVKNNSEWLVAIDTIESADNAQKLQDADVYIHRKDLGETSEENINSWNLAGYTVEDENFGALGKIKSIAEIHNNPLLEIEYNGKEVLIPFQEDFIVSIDDEKMTIILNTPIGLIDLYLE